MNDYYVYVHKRATTGEPFYYGRGRGNRAWHERRNAWYANVYKKHGRIIELLLTGLSEDESRAKEIEYIALARKNNENITNQTEGGDGISGIAARKIGLRHKQNKTSIFAPGMCSAGGKIASAKQRAAGTGIFAMTDEQHVAIGKKAFLEKTGIHAEGFDKRAASLIGANMPWWVDSVTGKFTRAYEQPSPDHVRGYVPAGKMPWWYDPTTGKSTRSFEPIEGYIKGRGKVNTAPYKLVWMSKDGKSKRVRDCESEKYLADGYSLGRANFDAYVNVR